MSTTPLTFKPSFRFLIQVRQHSKRLPEKCFAPIGGKPLLAHLLLRLKHGFPPIPITLLIPTGDKKLKHFAQEYQVHVLEGDSHNVYSRFRKAAFCFSEDYFFRFTGDNPFVDLQGVFQLQEAAQERLDYAYTQSLPLGMGCELIARRLFCKYDGSHFLPHEKEHVTVYFRETQGFRCKGVVVYPQTCARNLRLTVDEKADLKVAQTVFSILGQENPYFNAPAVFQLAQTHPEIFSINRQVQQKSPYSYEKPPHNAP